MTIRIRLIALVAAGLLVLGACGSSGDDTVQAGDSPGDTAGDTAGGSEGTDNAPIAGACLLDQPDCVDTIVGPPGDLPGDDPDTPVSSPDQPADDGVVEPSPRVVEPSDDAVQARPHQWQEVLDDGDGDDTTFLVAFYGGVEPCFLVDRVEVDEGDDAVTVTLYAGSSAEAARGEVACIEIAEYLAVQVELSEPLGGREVRDGAVS